MIKCLMSNFRAPKIYLDYNHDQ
uniref:Uncharacterized protein n=1 Tax=Arundo donax TaxID=35708 RepID=A0A0A8YF16_ARUDO